MYHCGIRPEHGTEQSNVIPETYLVTLATKQYETICNQLFRKKTQKPGVPETEQRE